MDATVAERLACSPPTWAIRVHSPAGSLRIFACGNRAGRCRWSAGFLGDLPFPPPFHSGVASYSPKSPSLALKTSQNLFTNLVRIRRGPRTVAEWLAHSPPTNPPGSIPAGSPDFREWESFRTMPLFGGFSRRSPVSPTPSFRRRSVFASVILIGSEDLDVKTRPNLFISLSVGKRFTGAAPECKSGGKCEIPEKTRRPASPSGTISTCENLDAPRGGKFPYAKLSHKKTRFVPNLGRVCLTETHSCLSWLTRRREHRARMNTEVKQVLTPRTVATHEAKSRNLLAKCWNHVFVWRRGLLHTGDDTSPDAPGTEKRRRDKSGIATAIKCAIAAKRKGYELACSVQVALRAPTGLSEVAGPEKFSDLQARLYSRMYRYADINCALVICCHSGRRRLGHRSPGGVKRRVNTWLNESCHRWRRRFVAGRQYSGINRRRVVGRVNPGEYSRTLTLGSLERTPKQHTSPSTRRHLSCVHGFTTSLQRTSSARYSCYSNYNGPIAEPMRVIEVKMERCRNEGAGETGDHRENQPINGIVRHDSHLENPVTRPGIEPVVSLLAYHQGDPGSIPGRVTPDFRMWKSYRTMALIGGFSRGSPVPQPFHFGATLYSSKSPSSALKTPLTACRGVVGWLAGFLTQKGWVRPLTGSNSDFSPMENLVASIAIDRLVFSKHSRLPHYCIPALFHFILTPPELMISAVSASQITL
ncbi:hypothetical protein PR048_008287 [Dryococelus australis]|uniref:Uncharacterized protein n=1 Tax=Dryococelus australis TaxID=614101 RepID=A0ABQ9HWP3_9NEOP|nr:hypothetical protein PR048_008287 [Dryococelus australis]